MSAWSTNNEKSHSASAKSGGLSHAAAGQYSGHALLIRTSSSPVTSVADPCELHVDSEDQIVDFRNIPSKTFIKVSPE